MSIERVRAEFEKLGIAERMLEFPVSSATVELAAKAVGTEEARIAKTLSFHDGDGCMLIVTAGDTKIDNSKFKARFGNESENAFIGGSVCNDRPCRGWRVPGFALPEGVKVFLDVSMRRFTTVFPAVGSANPARLN